MLNRFLRLPRYTTKKYPKERLETVQELFSKAFNGRLLSINSIKWQMENNPCLKERATSLWQDDILVAYNALTPFSAILKGKEIIAAVSGTSMVNENYLGASVQLHQETEKQNQDINVIYGFPNRNSFGIAVKYLKHRYIGDIAFWVANAEPKAYTNLMCEMYSFSDEFEEISRKLAKEHDFIKIRYCEFLNWRFFQKPNNSYKGFAFLEDGRKHGYIIVNTYLENGIKQLQVVDILADSKAVFKQLLLFAVNLAYNWECKHVKLWLSSDFYRNVMVDSGFTYGEHPFKMVVWNGDLNISRCYLTMADSDIF